MRYSPRCGNRRGNSLPRKRSAGHRPRGGGARGGGGEFFPPPPRLDGGRPGTFWFNTLLPTAGTGWDIEVVAFHEAVPGHHLQLSRLQLLEDLPGLQRQRSITVFSEGWGLYAEQLAEEAGLYTDDRARLGAGR